MWCSRFKLVAYFVFIFFIILFSFIIFQFQNITKGFNSIFGAYLTFILLVISFLVVFFELRDKVIFVKFENSSIKIKRFIGIFKSQNINNIKITGFYNSSVKTGFGRFNYLYLMIDNKKIAKISNQYHKNYEELKGEIERKHKDLGFIKTGLLSEFKDFIK